MKASKNKTMINVTGLLGPVTVPVARRTLLGASLLGASSLVLAPGVAHAMPNATTMRMHDHGAFTRLVIELSESVEASAFVLSDPRRLVVDLPEIAWGVDLALPKTAVVNAVRAGVFQPGQSRLVIDLAQAAQLSQGYVLPPTGVTPWRLILDLTPATEDAFRAAATMNQITRIGPQGGATVAAAKSVAPPPKVAAAEKPAAKKATDRKIVVAIDPGHGGIDPGAIGVGGVYEKNITLMAAQQLKQKLEATGRYRAILTRSQDTSLFLRERIEIARHAPADIFISLHADSIQDKSIRGLSVYTLSEKASDVEAEAFERRQRTTGECREGRSNGEERRSRP